MSDDHSGPVSMASISILFFFAVIGLHEGYKRSFININCTSEIKGEYGQTSVLECKISTSEEVKNAEITWLAWRKNGVQEPLLFYNNQNLEAKPGYSFAQQNWKKSLDVSLRIAHTKVQDEGVYTCQVATSGGKAEGPNWSRLYVTARYNVTTLHTGDGDDPECFASGGYPKGQIRWFDGDSQEMTENATMEEWQTEEGLFLLSSRLNLQKGFVSSSCTCAVYNASGVREQENTFKFYPEGPKEKMAHDPLPLQIKIVAPVVVIGSVIVGLLLLLVCRRRRHYHHPKGYTCEAEPPGNACEDQKTTDEEPRET